MVNVPENGRSDVLPGLSSRARSSSAASSPTTPSLPNPQLNQHRTVVRELIPHRFVSLAGGDLAERAAIHPGQDPLVNHEVIDELGERMIPAADGHVLRHRGEIGVGGLATQSASIERARSVV
jgi:hypothetical protein